MAKKRKSNLKNAARAQPEQRSNPFEELHNRKKFSILGRRAKGDKARKLQARTDAVAKVQPCVGVQNFALLVEYTPAPPKGWCVVNLFLHRCHCKRQACVGVQHLALHTGHRFPLRWILSPARV